MDTKKFLSWARHHRALIVSCIAAIGIAISAGFTAASRTFYSTLGFTADDIPSRGVSVPSLALFGWIVVLFIVFAAWLIFAFLCLHIFYAVVARISEHRALAWLAQEFGSRMHASLRYWVTLVVALSLGGTVLIAAYMSNLPATAVRQGDANWTQGLVLLGMSDHDGSYVAAGVPQASSNCVIYLGNNGMGELFFDATQKVAEILPPQNALTLTVDPPAACASLQAAAGPSSVHGNTRGASVPLFIVIVAGVPIVWSLWLLRLGRLLPKWQRKSVAVRSEMYMALAGLNAITVLAIASLIPVWSIVVGGVALVVLLVFERRELVLRPDDLGPA